MKLNHKNLQIEESGLNIQSSRNMIFKIIDAQIMNYKLQFQTDWEKDHTLSPIEKNNKIEKLETVKQELRTLFLNNGLDDSEVSFSLNLDVKVKTKSDSEVSRVYDLVENF